MRQATMPPLFSRCRSRRRVPQGELRYSSSSSSLSVSKLPPLSLLPSTPSFRHILQAHAQLVVLGHASGRAATGHLLAACAVASSIPPAYPRAVFRRLLVPNVFSTNNLIRCSSSASEAVEVYAAMRRSGTPTNNFTFPFVLEACGKSDPPLLPEGLQIHAHVVKLGYHSDVFVRNALMHLYGVARRVEDARKLFDEMLTTENAFDGVSWSIMILGYVRAGLAEEGLGLFREMMRTRKRCGNYSASSTAGFRWVNEATLVTVLSACGQLGLLRHGEFVHREIKAMDFPITLRIGTALVDMYAKCGCISMSRRVFDEMPRREVDVFAWNSMLCGLAAHGLGREALELFERFGRDLLRPTSVTFVGVLNGCSRAGLVEEGRRHFESMESVYGIEPEMEHYGCMVDMLGRAGLVSEAMDLINGMRIPPDPVLWGTLLGACKIHGLVDLGAEIGNKLIQLEPTHDGHYVLLSGIYAKSRKWDDVARVRNLMSARGTTKLAGWSFIEAEGRVHRFVAGDREQHPRSAEIHQMNNMILKRLTEAGYVPDVSSVLHDIGDEEKVHVIHHHSERLAIAFGLLVVAVGQPIRVVKNLRVCGDCHVVSKMISKVFRREIIVRDGSRFHHFKDGTCSCNDFW